MFAPFLPQRYNDHLATNGNPETKKRVIIVILNEQYYKVPNLQSMDIDGHFILKLYPAREEMVDKFIWETRSQHPRCLSRKLLTSRLMTLSATNLDHKTFCLSMCPSQDR